VILLTEEMQGFFPGFYFNPAFSSIWMIICTDCFE